jgi:cobalt-zinc-cadmium resistance protein CzcA
MLDRLIQFVLLQRLLVILGTILMVIAGVWAWNTLTIDAFPDVTNVQVMMLTDAPGLSPEDVEQRITFPVELSMQGLPQMREIRSLSKAGLSLVTVIFEDDVDIYFARQLVFQRLQEAKEDLPEWAEPEMGPISTGLGEIYQYTVESEERSPTELRTIQDWLIAPQLRTIPGVNEVNSFGGFVKQYHILVNPASLQKYGLTLNEVLEAVKMNNSNAGGNFIQMDWEQAYTRSIGMIGNLEDIQNIVLSAWDGTPLYLRDVADVQIGHQIREGAVTRDGKGEQVAGMVIMLRGENSKLIVDRVKKAIPQIQESLPEDVKISPFYDRTSLIQACVNTVGKALSAGGIFVILALFLFLWNARAALITALSLPLTALITFILMGWQGVTANLMSLGGLAIAVGMIADGSIVICENIVRHLNEKPDRANKLIVIAQAVREVARPVVFSILIIVIVFLPLFTLEQMEGKMFKPLAMTMIFAMLGSLIIALTIVPVLSSIFIKPKYSRGDAFIVRQLKKWYMPLLSHSLKFPRITVLLAVAVFILSLLLAPFVGMEFLPQLDEGAIAINVVRLPSASLEGSVAVGSFMEEILLGFPEVETVVTKTGRAEISEDPMGPEQSDVIIMLHPESKWMTGRSKAELIKDIQKALSIIPGVRFSFSQPIALRVNELISGSDIESLKEYANKVAVVLKGIEGAEDVKVEQISGFSQVDVAIDRQAIARHKINVADVNNMIETAIGGKTATTVIEGQMRFAAQVRFPKQYRGDMEACHHLMVLPSH